MSSTPMKLEDVWKGKHWFTRLTTWSKRRLYTALARASRALFACSTLRGTLGRERQSGAVTDCPKLGHAGPLFKMNSPSSFYLFICSYKNQPNSNLAGELCRGWRFLFLHRFSSRKLCDGVKGPTLCKINFNAFHNNVRFSPSSEPSQQCEKFKFYIHCLLCFSQTAWPKCAVLKKKHCFLDVTKGANTPRRCLIHPLSPPCICPLPHMWKVQWSIHF